MIFALQRGMQLLYASRYVPRHSSVESGLFCPAGVPISFSSDAQPWVGRFIPPFLRRGVRAAVRVQKSSLGLAQAHLMADGSDDKT
jgi:hypothetical protein